MLVQPVGWEGTYIVAPKYKTIGKMWYRYNDIKNSVLDAGLGGEKFGVDGGKKERYDELRLVGEWRVNKWMIILFDEWFCTRNILIWKKSISCNVIINRRPYVIYELSPDRRQFINSAHVVFS